MIFPADSLTPCHAPSFKVAAPQVVPPKKLELIQIPFEKLLGIDPVMSAIMATAGLDYSLPIDIEAWDTNALCQYLETHPILVRPSKSDFYCISGFRRLRLAQALFSDNPDKPISVISRNGNLSTSARHQLLAIELFADRAITRTDRSEAPELYECWRAFKITQSCAV